MTDTMDGASRTAALISRKRVALAPSPPIARREQPGMLVGNNSANPARPPFRSELEIAIMPRSAL